MWILLAATAAAVAVLARFGLVTVVVRGISMQPTLYDGQRLLALRRGLSRAPRTGDIVVCHPPPIPGQLLGPGRPDHGPPVVKRIAGLDGDTVVVGGERRTVPAGHVWVRGDGAHTYDSDHFGPLPERAVFALVLGRRRRQRWPLTGTA